VGRNDEPAWTEVRTPIENADNAQDIVDLVSSFTKYAQTFSYTYPAAVTLEVSQYVADFKGNSFASSYIGGTEAAFTVAGGLFVQMDGNTFTDTYSSENAAMLAEYTNSVVKLAAYPTPGTDVGSEMGGASVVLLKHCYFASISNLSVQHTEAVTKTRDKQRILDGSGLRQLLRAFVIE